MDSEGLLAFHICYFRSGNSWAQWVYCRTWVRAQYYKKNGSSIKVSEGHGLLSCFSHLHCEFQSRPLDLCGEVTLIKSLVLLEDRTSSGCMGAILRADFLWVQTSWPFQSASKGSS